MKNNWLSLAGGLGLAALLLNAGSFATPAHLHAAALCTRKEPDNTTNNKRADGENRMSADQQKQVPANRQLAQKIRKSIVGDKTLSTYGHNVKLIVRNGTVTLKGPVQSEDEKDSIAAKPLELRERIEYGIA